jgi:hypothetical protein
MKDILAAVRKDDLLNSGDLHELLRRPTDEYAKASPRADECLETWWHFPGCAAH